MGEQPTGDFTHDPAFEQREDTPLPIHVEYQGTTKVTRVVVKYKSAQMRDWARVELKKVGEGAWEGLIPCADVGRGTMRYWVQGFDRTGEPLLATGDPKHPYYVPIREKITSEPPHLPGKEAPKSCEETDCPPGLPGCKRKKAGGAEGGGGAAAEGEGGGAAGEGGGGGEEGEGEKGKAGPYRRMWGGIAFAFDFVPISGVSNVCARNGMTGAALNSQGYYCYDSSAGRDFPDMNTNTILRPGGAGTSNSGVQLGNVRALLTFDYALSPNFLAGARLGYVFGTYPGQPATHFAPVHVEARATYLFGSAPLSQGGFAPMVLAGLGVAEYDTHQSTYVSFTTPGMSQKIVDVWATNAPFFIVLGGGARYQFGKRVALLAALRLNLVVGGNGFLPTFGPELGGQYAF
jgi:hypothetical protein